MEGFARLPRARGQGLAEYALILTLISLAVIVALTAIAGAISGLLSTLSGSL